MLNRKMYLILMCVSCFLPVLSTPLIATQQVSSEQNLIEQHPIIFDLLFPEEKEKESYFLDRIDLIQKDRMPKHIAFILDGNRRWAKKKGLSVAEGHWSGSKNVSKIIKFIGDADLGIEALTLYAFSTENWSRSQLEIDEIMKVVSYYLDEQLPVLVENSIRFETIGDLTAIPIAVQEKIANVKQLTSSGTKFTLILALNYGGRDEIRRVFSKMATDLERGVFDKEDISERLIQGYLDTSFVGDPDLIIRTSGEQRISNFLLWQMAYSELYFSPVLWPDFSEQDLVDALLEFQSRSRRGGK